MKPNTTETPKPATADSVRNSIRALVNDGKFVTFGKWFATKKGEQYFCATIVAGTKSTSASEVKYTTDVNKVFGRLGLKSADKEAALMAITTVGNFVHGGKTYAPNANGEWALPKTAGKPGKTGRTLKALSEGKMLVKVANCISKYASETGRLPEPKVQEAKS